MKLLSSGTCVAVFILIALRAVPASAHWDMEPRFWADDAKETFHLTIHNVAHGDRSPGTREMNVCFWIEGLSANSYSAVSDKKCREAVLKPNQWLEFLFQMRETVIQDRAKNGAKLKKGNYRAVVLAREQRGRLAKILFGAALERLYSYFDVK